MIKYKIVRSGQGGRIPAKHKKCKDCGQALTKYRFDLFEYWDALVELSRSTACPQCVLLAYVNSKATFWQKLFRFFKPKYARADVVELKKEVQHQRNN